MALRHGALRDALIDVGASEAKAERAAYDWEFADIRGEMQRGFARCLALSGPGVPRAHDGLAAGFVLPGQR